MPKAWEVLKQMNTGSCGGVQNQIFVCLVECHWLLFTSSRTLNPSPETGAHSGGWDVNHFKANVRVLGLEGRFCIETLPGAYPYSALQQSVSMGHSAKGLLNTSAPGDVLSGPPVDAKSGSAQVLYIEWRGVCIEAMHFLQCALNPL